MSDDETNLSKTDVVLRDLNGVLTATLPQDKAIEIIARLRETYVAERGRAFFLSNEPLVERLGSRWGAKREAVWDHIRSNFERRLQEPDWCVPLADLGWLFILPTLGARQGALRCADIWAETGQFFVGEGVKINLPLFEANAVGSEQVSLKPIELDKYFDRDELFPGAADPPSRRLPGQAQPDRASQAIGDMRAMNRQASAPSGFMRPESNLHIACAIEPVFEMKQLIIIGHRLEPLVVDSLSNMQLDARALKAMDWAKREYVDMANIAQGISLLMGKPPEKRKTLIIVPVVFSTIASARARNRIIADVSRAAAEMKMKVLYEIRDLGGVPPHRILEIVSLLRPFCMTVVGHVQPEMKPIRNMKECGLSGVCIDYDGLERNEALLRDHLTALATHAKASSGACMVQGFSNFRQMAVAKLAGITHASIRSSALTSTGSRA